MIQQIVQLWLDKWRGLFEILLLSEGDHSGNAWVHFRAPDGNIYEFTQDPGVSRPQ